MTSQRKRVYDSEDILIGPVDWYPGLDWAQWHVNEFISKAWWRTNSPVRYVTLDGPAKTTGATREDAKHWRIGFRPTSLCDLNVGHELTHVFVGVSAGLTPEDHEEDHDSRFAGAELEVVKRFISASVAAMLRAKFEEAGVRITPWESTRGVV